MRPPYEVRPRTATVTAFVNYRCLIVLLVLLDVVILFILGHHVKVYGATRKVTPRQKEQIPSDDLKLVYMRA